MSWKRTKPKGILFNYTYKIYEIIAILEGLNTEVVFLDQWHNDHKFYSNYCNGSHILFNTI